MRKRKKARKSRRRTQGAASSRLREAFRASRRAHRPALVAYVTAGDPNLTFTEALVLRLAAAGADVIELGVPFSDPIADGPVIQRASERALRAGTTLSKVLKLAARIRRQSDVPLVLFSYYNPVLQLGLERFAARAAAAGVDGVLITDLTPEEAGGFVPVMRRARPGGLDTVFLVAPTSTNARLRAIVRRCNAFVYVISRRGTTGLRADVPAEVKKLVARVRRLTRLPVAVGFGIGRREQVQALDGVADGVVVGSALVECCERHSHSARALEAAAQLVKALKGRAANQLKGER
ncbi:MAG: tryptophan synthase subunit alpha [Candidatus Acidiferrales bacterium]